MAKLCSIHSDASPQVYDKKNNGLFMRLEAALCNILCWFLVLSACFLDLFVIRSADIPDWRLIRLERIFYVYVLSESNLIGCLCKLT
jgi:hypothetical protein